MQVTCEASHTTHAFATVLSETAITAPAEAVAILSLRPWRHCILTASVQELGDLRSRLAQVEAAAQQQEQGPRRRRPSCLRDLVAAAAAEPIAGDLPAHWQASVQQLQDSSLDTGSSSLRSSSESVMDMTTVEVPVRPLQHSEHCAGVGSREHCQGFVHIQGTLARSIPNSIADSTASASAEELSLWTAASRQPVKPGAQPFTPGCALLTADRCKPACAL